MWRRFLLPTPYTLLPTPDADLLIADGSKANKAVVQVPHTPYCAHPTAHTQQATLHTGYTLTFYSFMSDGSRQNPRAIPPSYRTSYRRATTPLI
jgi:hypothetical protein